MLLKRNLLESLTVLCCGCSFIGIALSYATSISPITGIWFPIYVILLFFVSSSLSFKLLQWLLSLNRPLKYDLEELVRRYPFLGFLESVLPEVPKCTRHQKSEEYKEYDTNELSVISTVLERKLVSSWYLPYISQEIGFPFACKQLLDQIIGKAFQISNNIETKDLCIDVCTILTIHLREYKKAMKRHEKSPTSSIVSLYKTASPDDDFSKRLESSEHCFNILRIIFKELVPWELWDTPHSDLLIRILSKKLDSFIDNTIADPVWLNDKLLSYLDDKNAETETLVTDNPPESEKNQEKCEPEEEKNSEVAVEEQKQKPAITSIESALSSIVAKTTAPILHNAIIEEFKEEVIESTVNGEVMGEFVGLKGSNTIEILTTGPLLRQRRGRQGKSEVKIYDRVIEGSVKTWDTDMDLQCISLGQDLLASLDGEITLSRLWDTEEADHSPQPPSTRPQPLWFGEEDVLEEELSSPQSQQTSPSKREVKPMEVKPTEVKPTEVLLKDLQTTVREAKSKIGDLQVLGAQRMSVDVSGDEAAGMMEGLLDFGIAGLKKGLRFTGLSDDSQEKEKSPPGVKEKHGSSGSGSSPPLEKESATNNLSQKDDNAFMNNAPPLMKQHRVVSQDSVPRLPRHLPIPSPATIPESPSETQQPRAPGKPTPPVAIATATQPVAIATAVPSVAIATGGDSPEPQYEEAADLSTSIAKLRSLLQQREQFENKNEENNIWWETAEETRGRTQRHHSTRPVDTATLADEYDMQSDRNTSPNQSSNNMQRLDKLFQRTVTGVFNSIRTAVGAEGDEGGEPRPPPPARDWRYVCTSLEMSVGGAVARLVGSRRAYTHVDAALDSLEQLNATPRTAPLPPDDIDEWCSAEGACYSACAELTCAAGLTRSDTAHRLATVLLAEMIESLVAAWLDELTTWLKREIFATFERMSSDNEESDKKSRKLREFRVDRTCAVILEKLPPALSVFGEETLSRAVRLTVTSLSHRRLNRQLVGRLLAHAAVHWKKL